MTSPATSSQGTGVPAEVTGDVVADALAPAIEDLVDEVHAMVVQAVPPFEEWPPGADGMRQRVELALYGFVELLRRGADAQLPSRQAFFDSGRIEHRGGRNLDALLTAYRIGAQA